MTDEQEQKLLESLRAVGSHEDLACNLAGVSYQHYHARLREDPEFRAACQRARATAVTTGLAMLRLAGQERKHEPDERGRRPPRHRVSDRGDWRAVEAWLKLIEPERFAARITFDQDEYEKVKAQVASDMLDAIERADIPLDMRRRFFLAIVPEAADEIAENRGENAEFMRALSGDS